MGFLNAIARGVRAAGEANGPGRYTAGGIAVACPHCKGDTFDHGEAQLNTAAATFMNLDWLNKSATLLVCARCGLIQWFAVPPEREG